MDKEKIKYIMFGFISFGIAVLLVNILKIKFRSTIIEYIISAIGLLFLIVAPYYLLKARKPSLLLIISLLFTLLSYVVIFVIKNYLPEFSVLLVIMFAFLAALSSLLATVYIFIELFKKKW